MVKVKIVNKGPHRLPCYSTRGSAGMDINAWIEGGSLTLMPGCRCLVPTGLYIELPEGYEAQLRPRSGLALRRGLTVANAPGTVDSDYRGEIGVILINLGQEPVEIKDGDRICQMVVAPVSRVEWEPLRGDEEGNLGDTERGAGGFGHTGV